MNWERNINILFWNSDVSLRSPLSCHFIWSSERVGIRTISAIKSFITQFSRQTLCSNYHIKMSDCKHLKKFRFFIHLKFELFIFFHFTAEKCDKCGSIKPKPSEPVSEPKTPSKNLSEQFEQCSPSKASPFKRLGSFLRGKSKDDSSSNKK